MASNRDSDIIHVKIDVLIDRFALLDSTRDDILFFQPDGTSISTLKIDLPSGNWQAAFWYNDLVYVLEDFFNRVRVFDIYGTEQTLRKIELGLGSWVGGVELDGKLWLIDDSNSELRAFNPDDGTEFTSDAFDVGRANGAYAYNGNIYVIDNIGREVEVWSPAGVEQTALGFNLDLGLWQGGLEFEGHSYLIDNYDLRAFDASGTEQESRNFDLPNNGFRGAFRLSSTAIAAKWSTIPDQDFHTSTAVDLDLTDYLSGDPDFTFTVTGLPSGLTLSAEGVLSGTPTTAGAFTVNITVSNNGGSESTSFTVDVSDVVAPVVRFYLVDDTPNRLRVFAPDGTENTTLRISLGTGSWAGGFEYNGNFYLFDVAADRLRVFAPDGTENTTLRISLGTGLWTGGFEYNGNFYLVDDTPNRLRVFAPDGTENTTLRISLGTGSWAGGFEYNGNFYLVDTSIPDRLRVFAPGGTENTTLRISLGTGAWLGGFEYNGNFYLVDNTPNRLRVFAPDGTENTTLRIDLGTGAWEGGFMYESDA